MGNRVRNFDFKGSPYEVALHKGIYLFEAWGASGYISMCGNSFDPKGRGAYTSGVITLKKHTKIFVYVGEYVTTIKETFNGNKNNYRSAPGGGATDFRLEKGANWYDLESLKSRIMVAAGGGGIDCLAGGDGGKLIGKSPANYDPHTIPGPGTQVSGGSAGRHTNLEYGYPGEFGIGGAGMCKTNCDGAGSGGGGYYGGGGMTGGGGGGGGSSFISGYEGCKAIDKITNKSTESPIHYSQLFFRSGRMFAGDEDMPAARSTNTIVGNTGNGFAKITAISLLQTCNKKTSAKTTTLIMLIILATK